MISKDVLFVHSQCILCQCTMELAHFMADISQSHFRKNTVPININTLMMYLSVPLPGPCYYACLLTQ